jgi:hypothetical protein
VKVLGNPWIVGGLCVIAVAVVGYQFLPPRSGAGVSPVPPVGVSAAPAPPSATPAPSVPATSAHSTQAAAHATAGTNAAPLGTPIDRAFVQSHFAQWLQAPQRDPFLSVPAAKLNTAPAPVSPVSRWKLKSIWRQTGSQLAAINKGVYSEGDVIEGYRIEQIEGDRVWFQGPTGRESLGFTNPQPPPGAATRTNGPNH